jgi:hypothetical protein
MKLEHGENRTELFYRTSGRSTLDEVEIGDTIT